VTDPEISPDETTGHVGLPEGIHSVRKRRGRVARRQFRTRRRGGDGVVHEDLVLDHQRDSEARKDLAVNQILLGRVGDGFHIDRVDGDVVRGGDDGQRAQPAGRELLEDHHQLVDGAGHDEQLALDREVIDQRAKLRALVKSRIEQQAATLLEQSLTEVDYLDARTQLAEVEVRRRGAYDELLLQLGLPAGERVELVSSSATCTPPEEATTLAERAHAANPRLRILDAEDTAVDAELRRRWLNLVPWFDYAQVGYGMAGDTRPSYVAFEFQLTLPILDWKRPHHRALSARHRALAERALASARSVPPMVLEE